MINRFQATRMRGGGRAGGTIRSGFAPSIKITSSGTSLNPTVYDGQGDVIDAGVYLDNSDWTDEGSNIWSTPANSFPSHNGHHPGWYKYASTSKNAGGGSNYIKWGFQEDTYLDGINMDGDVRVVPFNFDADTPNAQGEAVWDSATSSIHMYSVGNPTLTYGIIVIPNSLAFIGIWADNASHLRIRNYKIVHCYHNGFRSDGGSNIEVSNVETAYTGGTIQISTQTRPGDAITFNSETVSGVTSVSDLRVTGCKVYQTWDGAISFQNFNSSVSQTIDNIEFDNNIINYAASGLLHMINNGVVQHTYTNAITRDNVSDNIGYQMSTYQSFTSACRYASHVAAQPVTYFNAGESVSSTLAATAYNNSGDKYAGRPPGVWATTASGIYIPYGSTSINFERDENNVFTNNTDDRNSWIDGGEVCFDPYVDGFPTFP